MNSNIEKYTKAVGDMKILNRQFSVYTKTNKFEKAMQRKAILSPGRTTQIFYNEGRPIWDAFMREEGRVAGAVKVDGIDKTTLMNDVVAILSTLDAVAEFKMIDFKKRIAAIRTEEADFEITSTQHRDKVIEYDGTTKVVGTIKPHVEQLADKLLALDYNIVQVKNNMLTIETKDGEQLSAKITRKKSRLF